MSMSKKQTERTFEKYLEAKEEGAKDAWAPDIPMEISGIDEPEPDLMEEALQAMEAGDADPGFPQGDPEPADIPVIEAKDPALSKLAFEYIADKWGRTKDEARKRLSEAGHDAEAVFAKARAILRGEG